MIDECISTHQNFYISFVLLLVRGHAFLPTYIFLPHITNYIPQDKKLTSPNKSTKVTEITIAPQAVTKLSRKIGSVWKNKTSSTFMILALKSTIYVVYIVSDSTYLHCNSIAD